MKLKNAKTWYAVVSKEIKRKKYLNPTNKTEKKKKKRTAK